MVSLTVRDSFSSGDEPLRFMVNRSLLPDESSPWRGEATLGGFRNRESSPIPGPDMDGIPTMKAVAAAALALLALGGSIGPALAEDDAGIATPAVDAAEADANLPRFVPSAEAEAEFADAFRPFDDPAIEPAPAAPEDATGRAIGGGVASWYGPGFAGRKTASGERFDPGQYTAAHRTLPFGSRVRVTHNGRSVVVRINDRGPFHGGRVIDLSQAAAEDLGIRRAGSGRVELALVEG